MTLIVAPTAEPITLAEVKARLGIGATDQLTDADIVRRITGAREWAEEHCRRSFMPQTHELRLDAFPCDGQIDLPFPPVTSIVSVKYIAGDGTLTTVDAADYTLDDFPLVPFVRPVYGESWPSPRAESSAVRVRYAAGYAVRTLAPAKTLSAITAATPGVVTSAAHGYVDGDLVQLDIAGMTELDGLLYRVYGAETDSFKLANLKANGAISTTGYTAFTSGTATKVEVAVPEKIIEAICLLVGHWTNYQTRIEAGQFITRIPVAVEQLLDREKITTFA